MLFLWTMKEWSYRQNRTESLSNEGSVSAWSRIWSKDSKHMQIYACLFRTGRPRTIYEFWQQIYAHDLAQFARDHSYSHFLELGCGRATTSMYLRSMGYENIALIDLSPEALQRATANFIDCKLTLPEMYAEDVRKTGRPPSSYDCIFNIGLLEHFEDPQPVIKESFRLLKPGGALFMPIFPERTPKWSYLLRLIFNPLSFVKMAVHSFKGKPPDDMIRTSLQPEDYVEMTRNTGFQEVSCRYYNPFPKIIRDSWYENHVILPLYRMIYDIFFKKSVPFSFQTRNFFAIGYLLVAIKPPVFKK